ncbi:MAG: glycosyltransferase family 2 protein [Trichloromonadaceae bacterium]
MNSTLCLLTINSASTALQWLDAFRLQLFGVSDRLVIDSSSKDCTAELFAEAGFRIHSIPRDSFNHGATRQLAVDLCPDAEILIFMTQDALLATPYSLQNLVAAFSDPRVGAAFGRQLPQAAAGPIEAHARGFNYPPESRLKSSEDIPFLGIKTAFISNSFAAYRRSALEAVGGFPFYCIVSEDTFVATRMLLAGWQIAYCADAQVHHSHCYNYFQEFQRYFDIGVFHAREPWVRKGLGGAEGEGRKFFFSEMKFLMGRAPHLLLSACLRTGIKYLGYRTGLAENFLPLTLKRRLSMQKSYWRPKFKGMSDA